MRTRRAGRAAIDQGRSIELDSYVPYLIKATANKLSQSRSSELKKGFGIGLNEWSCLALLAKEPEIAATRICEVSGFNKAVISRSVQALEEKGFIRSNSVPEHNRKKVMSLTAEGRRVHNEIMKQALARQELLLSGLNEAQRDQLIVLLRILHGNVASTVDA